VIIRKRKKNRVFLARKLPSGFLIVFLSFVLPAKAFSEQNFRFRAYPGFYFPLGTDMYTPGFDMAAALDWRFLPFLGASVQGELVNLGIRETGDSIRVLDAGIGPLFIWRPLSRFSLQADINAGIYQASLDDGSISGISFGGRLSASYHLSPEVSLMAFGAYKQYAYTPKSFLNNITAGVGLTLDLSEILSSKTRIDVQKIDQKMVFPVSYGWYNENPFGAVRVTNKESNDITQVNVYFYLEQYMSQPKLCGEKAKLKPGESADIPLTAFFNDSILHLIENTSANAKIIVEYRSLGARRHSETPVDIPLFHRNAMSWDDDRRASSFVSARDPSAQWFSRFVSNLVTDRFRPGINPNIQFALALFEILNIYGINYVVDPSSSYIELSGSSGGLDSLNYPYQTLMYRGGDCDDLSILFCSLMEAAGIETAFITIPGHIYMAFDLGLTEKQAREEFYAPGELVFFEGRAWVPLEITIPKEGFYRAWRIGAKEWRDADERDAARFYPMHASWAVYPPVSPPGTVSRFVLPGDQRAALAFDSSMNRYIEAEIRPLIRAYENRLAEGEDPETRNALGVLYGRYGMLDRAREQFEIAARNDYSHSVINLGNVAFMEQNYAAAGNYYTRILEQDENNTYAILGMARCSYELYDFTGSDAWYANLRGRDAVLAGEYGYLGTFFQSKGRSYSLSGRLTTTLWSLPGLAISRTPAEKTGAGDSDGGLFSSVSLAGFGEEGRDIPRISLLPPAGPVPEEPPPVLEADSGQEEIPAPEIPFTPVLAALVPEQPGRRDEVEEDGAAALPPAVENPPFKEEEIAEAAEAVESASAAIPPGPPESVPAGKLPEAASIAEAAPAGAEPVSSAGIAESGPAGADSTGTVSVRPEPEPVEAVESVSAAAGAPEKDSPRASVSKGLIGGFFAVVLAGLAGFLTAKRKRKKS
jgi:hypothetical protein